MKETRRSFMGTVAATAGAAALGTGLAGARQSSDSITFEEDFDTLSADWEVGTDIDSWYTGDWDASLVSSEDLDSRMMEFAADGETSSGMIWIYAPIDIEPGYEYDGKLTLRTYTPGALDDEVRLHASLAPSLPQTKEEFPSKQEAWRLYGDRLGINTDVSGTDGWSEFTGYWSSPEMETDQLYLAVGVSTEASTMAYEFLDSLAVELTPSGTTSSDIINNVSMKELDEKPDREIKFNTAENTITIRNTVQSPTPCHKLSVGDTTYDSSTETLGLDLALESSGQICTQVIDPRPFEMTIECSRMPENITVGMPNTERMAATRTPTISNVEIFTGDEINKVRHEADLVGKDAADWESGEHYDPSNNAVHIVDAVQTSNNCEFPVVSNASVKDGMLDVDVGIDQESQICNPVMMEVPFHIRVTFEDGLPGDVEYTLPSL